MNLGGQTGQEEGDGRREEKGLWKATSEITCSPALPWVRHITDFLDLPVDRLN